MRIGLLMPSIYASEALFPDKIFAPRELFTSLSNGLIGLGHDVIAYSVPDVDTQARVIGIPTDTVEHLLPYYKFRGLAPSQLQLLDNEYAKHQLELACITRAFEGLKRKEVDVLHVYMDSSYFFSHYFNDLLGQAPVLYTLHDPLPPAGTYEYHEFSRFADHTYVAISESFRKSSLALNFIATVYHGIPVSDYPFVAEPGKSLLFLGRLAPEKGLKSAVKAAIASKEAMTVSVNLPQEGETNVYYDSVRQDLSNPAFTVLPVVDKKRRFALYGDAKALVFPIEWEEPFGIVVIEAMATGTPVIAYNRGSVPELIRDGVTGFIVDPDNADRPGKGNWIVKKQGIEGLVEAIGLLPTIDRKMCRAHVEEKFSVESMAQGYMQCYEKVLKS